MPFTPLHPRPFAVVFALVTLAATTGSVDCGGSTATLGAGTPEGGAPSGAASGSTASGSSASGCTEIGLCVVGDHFDTTLCKCIP